MATPGPWGRGSASTEEPCSNTPNWLKSDLYSESFCSQELLHPEGEIRAIPKAVSFRKINPTELDLLTVLYLFAGRRIIKALKFNYN